MRDQEGVGQKRDWARSEIHFPASGLEGLNNCLARGELELLRVGLERDADHSWEGVIFWIGWTQTKAPSVLFSKSHLHVVNGKGDRRARCIDVAFGKYNCKGQHSDMCVLVTTYSSLSCVSR